MDRCQEKERITAETHEALTKISKLSGAQIDALRKNDHALVSRLDKELENAMGEKERALGALRQHRSEHGC